MNDWSAIGRQLIAAGLVLNLLSACGRSTSDRVSLPTAPIRTATPMLTPTVRPVQASATPMASNAPAATSTTSGQRVIVTTLGNVFVRRGPDLAFDPVGTLSKGQTAEATGRDVLSKWLRIPLPADASREGWISIMSDFTRVAGDANALPEIEPREWPDLAWLRNCTLHELWISPAGLALPPVFEFPNNELRLNPGTYTITDADVDGYPEILKVELREGRTVEVLVDGLGEKKKCPPR